jgi:glycosyltransferase involved in cell wall biosynthesis
VYNGEAHIAATLDSALRQTHRAVEVIVVDDGSTDGTRAIVEDRARWDSRVRVIGQKNRGVGAARNRALAIARGEFVAPLDADDLWDPSKIEQQLRRLREEGEGTGLAYCWWIWLDLHSRMLDRSPQWRIEGHTPDTLLQINYIGCASIPLYRRRLLEQVGGYDEKLPQGCEDWDLSLKVAEISRIAVVPAVLVGYRRRCDSMSTQTADMWRSYAAVIKGVRRRRPAVSAALIRRSRQQFALYLAGVSLNAGEYYQAFRWGWRAAGSSLSARLLPHAVPVIARKILGVERRPLTLPADLRLCDARLPPPLVPYDIIYARRFKQPVQ